MYRFILIFSLIISSMLNVFGQVQYLPKDDTYVRGGDNAGVNYGNDPDLVIKRGTVETFFRKVLLKFDLRGTSGISDEDSVVIKLFASTVDAAYPVTVYEISDDWDEETVTWSTAPLSGNVLGVIDFIASDIYYEWDITDYYRSQLVAGDSIISIALFDANNNNQKIAFNSKEAGINPPLLVISGQAGSSLELAQVMVDGEPLAEFDNPITEYQIDLPYTTIEVPTLSATAVNEDVRLKIFNATSLSGDVEARTARIIVTSSDSTQQKIFTFIFRVLPKLDLFLLIGQSNMAGRADIEVQDTAKVNGCLLAKTDNLWGIAENPLNKYSNIRKELSIQKLGPGYSFARTLVDSLSGKNFGLVVNARGGTSIASWLKGSSDGYYDKTIERVQSAMRYGTFKAILWHQGSSDQSNAAAYMGKLKTLVRDLRNDMGNENLFFLASQLGKWRTSSENINIVFTQVPDSIENSDFIISDGLTPLNGDTTDPHFDSRSQRIFGQRFAQKVLENIYAEGLSLGQGLELIVPENFSLSQNFPNPFNPQTTISYSIQKPAKVRLEVYDLAGRLTDILVNRWQTNGYYKVTWKPDTHSTGVYFYKLMVDNQSAVRKMLFIK